jgi:hypothetical protein
MLQLLDNAYLGLTPSLGAAQTDSIVRLCKKQTKFASLFIYPYPLVLSFTYLFLIFINDAMRRMNYNVD